MSALSIIRVVWPFSAVLLVLVIVLLVSNEYAFARASRRVKNIAYVPTSATDFDSERHLLDVYTPHQQAAAARPVVIFIHGGNWNSGSKNWYAFIGRRLAKQGVVAVILNYRLSPAVMVPAMANDCARAVAWVSHHIADYGGDSNRIFVMGHSAGGGLAALLATDNQLFRAIGLANNPIKGAVLDDPAGLDMLDYLTKMQYDSDEQYLIPFGKDPAVWRAMSALYQVEKNSPPMRVYVGEKTYPSILSSSQRFNQRLTELGVKHTYTILAGKKHVGMVTQLFWKTNRIYRDLVEFVGSKPAD